MLLLSTTIVAIVTVPMLVHVVQLTLLTPQCVYINIISWTIYPPINVHSTCQSATDILTILLSRLACC